MSYSQYLQGKAIQTGCEWRLKIKITSQALDLFPVGATFAAQFRDHADGPIKAALTTASGGIIRVDSNSLEFVLRADQTADWKAGKVVMDAIRTDGNQPAHLGFDLEIPVKRTITRL